MRGKSTPLAVEVTSSSDDPLGVVVPIPAAPVVGKVLVCAWAKCEVKMQSISALQRVMCVFIGDEFLVRKKSENHVAEEEKKTLLLTQQQDCLRKYSNVFFKFGR
jgi:hypothetical protein